MNEIKYYILDLETNGLQNGYHEVVELSIIRATDRLQLTRQIKAQFPERSSIDALTITGKTLADLSIGKSHSEVVKEVNDFFEMDSGTPDSRCLTGHNIISFDRKFLHSMWEQEGATFPANLYLDTLHLTKQFLKTHDLDQSSLPKTARGKVSTKLQAALQITGAQQINKRSHTAKSDTQNTFMLWKKLVEDHQMDYLPFIKNLPHYTAKLENITDEEVEMAETE